MSALFEIGVANAAGATVLALLVAAISKLLRRPPLAHTLWLLVLLKLVSPPMVTIPVPVLSAFSPTTVSPIEVAEVIPLLQLPTEAVVVAEDRDALVQASNIRASRAPEPMSVAPPVPAPPQGSMWVLSPWIGTLWGVGCIVWFTIAVIRIVRFHRLLRYGEPAPSLLQDEGRRLARRLGIDRCPELWLVPGRVSPSLWAMAGQARLVLPKGLLGRLTAQQRATLLTHELAHAKRLDHWVRWLELVTLGLYWWHPVTWWARWEIRQAEERCCDAWVVWALPDFVRAYAEMLLETVRFLSDAHPAMPPMASGIGHVQFLKRRLTMILSESLYRRVSWQVQLGVIVLGLAVLPITPRSLTAQEADKSADASLADGGEKKTEAEKGDLERRLRRLEDRMNQVLTALEQLGKGPSSDEPALKDGKGTLDKLAADAVKDLEGKIKSERIQAMKEAKAAASEAARKAKQEAKKQAEASWSDAVKKANAAYQASVHAAHKAQQDAEATAKEAGKIAQKLNADNIFAEQQAENLQRQIDDVVKEVLDPKRMQELGRVIEEAVAKAVDPERMEQLGQQIEEAVQQAVDPGRMEKLSRTIEELVKRSINPDIKPLRQIQTLQPQLEGPSSKIRPVETADWRRLEERVRSLEVKLDRVIELLESHANSSK
jgi:beta-lactamase regulating signal transducer with metallopeptidase domain